MKMWKNKTILIVIPSYDWNVRSEVMDAMNLLNIPEWYETTLRVIERKLIHVARNMAINEAIVWKYDYLLFCDDDNAPQPDALELLLEADKDIITWIIRKRSAPHHLAIYKWNMNTQEHKWFIEYEEYENIPDVSDDIFQVANCWTWFVLYKVNMLKKLYVTYDYMPFENRLVHYVPTHIWQRVEAERAFWNPLMKVKNDWTIDVIKRWLSEDLLCHERIRNWWYTIYAHKRVNLIHYDGEKAIHVEAQ